MKSRVVFLVRLKPGAEEAFLAAYESIRRLVAEEAEGHLVDQVCQSADDPESWMITSEWRSLEDFLRWEASEEHRRRVRPLRECIAEAQSLRFLVHVETGH
jgi:heme-degrading monooxygenase HmoA